MGTRTHTPSGTVEADLDGTVAHVVLRGEFDLTSAQVLEEMLGLVISKPPGMSCCTWAR